MPFGAPEGRVVSPADQSLHFRVKYATSHGITPLKPVFCFGFRFSLLKQKIKMKQTILLSILVIACVFTSIAQTGNSAKTLTVSAPNTNYSKAGALQAAMDKYTALGLPGVSLAIYTEKEGWWSGASGFSNVEKKTAMQTTHLQYTQSVSKTYLAVAVLKLHEKGMIDLDASITKYISARHSRYIPDGKRMTVRMLLNHTSGLPEYSTQPSFTSQVIEHPLHEFNREDCLKSIAKEPLQFEPGSKYRYTNTNYMLLSIIVDELTGDHAAYITKHIFTPLGLKNSFYGNDHRYLTNLNITDSYWDVLNTGRPANITAFQKTNVSSLKGDDGIVCTPADATAFLKGLFEGKLLTDSSMKQMMNFVKDENGQPRYGMGMFHFDLGGITAYGHGGGGVGAGCVLMYIPQAKTYLFLATNLGLLVEGNLATKAEALKGELFGVIMQ
jgi:D-alanyl-D-alanine carboxypeptidase